MLSRGTMRAERSLDPLDRHSRLSLLWCMAHQHHLAPDLLDTGRNRSSAPTSSSLGAKILYARWRYVHDQVPGQELRGELMERRTSTFEKHYRVKELTVLRGLGRETVRKISEDGPQEGAHRLRGAGIGSASNPPTADRITLTNGHGRRNPICSICRIAGEFTPCVGLAPARAWACRRRLP